MAEIEELVNEEIVSVLKAPICADDRAATCLLVKAATSSDFKLAMVVVVREEICLIESEAIIEVMDTCPR